MASHPIVAGIVLDGNDRGEYAKRLMSSMSLYCFIYVHGHIQSHHHKELVMDHSNHYGFLNAMGIELSAETMRRLLVLARLLSVDGAPTTRDRLKRIPSPSEQNGETASVCCLPTLSLLQIALYSLDLSFCALSLQIAFIEISFQCLQNIEFSRTLSLRFSL